MNAETQIEPRLALLREWAPYIEASSRWGSCPRLLAWGKLCLTAKEPLAKALGLGPDLRVQVGSASTEGQKTEWIQLGQNILALAGAKIRDTALLPAQGLVTLPDGRGVKLGKALAIAGVPEQDKRDLLDQYAKLRDNRAQVWLSLNPVDYLLMSESRHYSSCHRLRQGDRGNNFSAGCLAYGLDGVTAVAYILNPKEPDHKLGRALVWIDLTHYTFLVGRAYGWINAEHARQISTWIGGTLADSTPGLPNEWIGDAMPPVADVPLHLSQGDFPGYWDGHSYLRYTWHSAQGPHKRDTTIAIQLHDGFCLSCGGSTEEHTGPHCEDCRGSELCCCDCGDSLDEDDSIAVDEDIYCGDCYDERFFSCHKCGEATSHADGVQVEDDTWCSYCADRYTAYCADCGHNVLHQDYAGNELCIDHGASCRECGDLVPIDDLENDLCPDCGAPCAHCGEVSPKDAMVDGACPDCQGQAEEQEEGSAA